MAERSRRNESPAPARRDKRPDPGKPPTVGEMGEDNLIAAIRRWIAKKDALAHRGYRPAWMPVRAEIGPGDDTAFLRPCAADCMEALTTDTLVEGTHFLPDHAPVHLGGKSANASLSDLAAAGAWPEWVLVSLGLPPRTLFSWVRDFYTGVLSALSPYGCRCLGGDCVRSEKAIVSVTAGGLCPPGIRPPLRSAARPGQMLYITGCLGSSGAGLEVLRCWSQHGKDQGPLGASPAMQRAARRLVDLHLDPSPRVAAGVEIAARCPDVAMMDLSDGLGVDLPRLLKASGCAAEVRLAGLPLSTSLKRVLPALAQSGEAFALWGGEDYELVFATAEPESNWRDAVANARPGARLRISRIGRIIENEPGTIRYLDRDGRTTTPPGRRFEHFE